MTYQDIVNYTKQMEMQLKEHGVDTKDYVLYVPYNVFYIILEKAGEGNKVIIPPLRLLDFKVKIANSDKIYLAPKEVTDAKI